jgi:hypothetical protein
MLDREVDKVSCDANLRSHIESTLTQSRKNEALELGIWLPPCVFPNFKPTGLGVFKVGAESMNPRLRSFARLDVGGLH